MCADKLVKVFTRDEWDQLNARMHAEEMLAVKSQQELEFRRKIKEESNKIHKHWVNTIMGTRKKKLKEREERLRKEEEERIIVDQDWAKVQAEDRRKNLCYARTLQLYNTPRINKFHVCIHLVIECI